MQRREKGEVAQAACSGARIGEGTRGASDGRGRGVDAVAGWTVWMKGADVPFASFPFPFAAEAANSVRADVYSANQWVPRQTENSGR